MPNSSGEILSWSLALAVGVPVGRRSGVRLATTLVATITLIIFRSPLPVSTQFFSSVANFSHRRSAQIKKLIVRKLLRMPRARRPFWGPLAAIFGFCRRCGVAGGERVPPLELGWCSTNFC